jgi:hypothetical protein
MDVISKTEYTVRDLGTKSVTLFPTKAQICREIQDVALKVRKSAPNIEKSMASLQFESPASTAVER